MKFAVVCSHFNPFGYHEPRRNLLRFLRQMETQGIQVFVSELAYDDEPAFLPETPTYFHYRTSRQNILWHKENLLNLTVNALPATVEKVAWIDPDVWFMRQDWFRDAEAALDRWPIIQLFSKALWTDRDGKGLWEMGSCAHAKMFRHKHEHPGLAWAARREFWTMAGGLCDRAILGAADVLLTAACLDTSVPDFVTYPSSAEWMREIQSWVGHNGGLGFVDGLVVHEWHGDLADRNYLSRHEILACTNVDLVLARRDDGILEFADSTPPNVILQIQKYFQLRNEDGHRH